MSHPSMFRRVFAATVTLALCALPATADDAFQVTQGLRFVRVSSWVTETQAPFGQDFHEDELVADALAPFDDGVATSAAFLEGSASSNAVQVSTIEPAGVSASGEVSVSGEALCCVLEATASASSVVDVSFVLGEPRDFVYQGQVDTSAFVGVQTFLLRGGVPVFNETFTDESAQLDLSGLLPAGTYRFVVRAGIAVFADGEPLSDGASFDVSFELLREASAWTDLGHALAGSAGVPSLLIEGTLTPGSPLALTLSDALPNAPAALVLGLDALEAAFKGGVLVPVPSVVLSNLVTSAAGEISLQTSWVDPSPSGASLYVQVWLMDPGGPLGFAASNAVRGDVP